MDDRHRIMAYLAALDTGDAQALRLDEDGSCAMRLFDDLDCSVEVPADAGVVVFTADLVAVDAHDEAAVFRRAMALNCYGRGTGGNTLGYDAVQGCIVLCRHHPVEELTPYGFEGKLVAFLSAALAVRDRLRGEETRAGTGEPGQSPLLVLV